jgi:hypothetical protein
MERPATIHTLGITPTSDGNVWRCSSAAQLFERRSHHALVGAAVDVLKDH